MGPLLFLGAAAAAAALLMSGSKGGASGPSQAVLDALAHTTDPAVLYTYAQQSWQAGNEQDAKDLLAAMASYRQKAGLSPTVLPYPPTAPYPFTAPAPPPTPPAPKPWPTGWTDGKGNPIPPPPILGGDRMSLPPLESNFTPATKENPGDPFVQSWGNTTRRDFGAR